jgi:acyl CoA:acetate/3-ketoacid CoA transferase beta subunit
MDSDLGTLATKTTLARRICTALTTLVLVVLLGMSGEAVALVSQSIDPDPATLEKTMSLTEEQVVIRVAPRKAQTKNEQDVASPGQGALCLAPCAIVAEGQIAFALPNGGRPSAVNPTGPPAGRV